MIRRSCYVGLFLLMVVFAPVWAQAETDYLAVFMEGKKVGHSVNTRTVEGGQVTTSEQVSITISRLGIPVTIEMTTTSVETPDGKPLRFESAQLLGTVTMKTVGVVKDGGAVDVVSSQFGVEQKSTIQWPQGALMSEGLRRLTMEKGLKPGVEYSAVIFDPGMMQGMVAKVAIKDKKEVDLLGRVVKLTEVVTTMNMPGRETSSPQAMWTTRCRCSKASCRWRAW